MLATCSKCGNFISRYSNDEYKKPCDVCGSVLFFVRHLGFGSLPTHDILMNVETNEVLSDDPCNYYKDYLDYYYQG
jgi:translation initiation factor 2 gamma subunit (eIF-2gamma)